MFWMSIDLNELADLDRDIRFFRHNRRAPVSILDRDYGGQGHGNIKDRIQELIHRAGIHEPITHIELMTIPRVAGYVFNPVSFYLCSSPEGSIRALVAEVRNTFGEVHHYVSLLESDDQTDPTVLRCRIPKQFYVSPFFRVDGEYLINLKRSGDHFSIDISLHDNTGHVFSASMVGVGQELTSRNLRRTLMRSPFFALSIMTKIHWQALRLYFVRGLRMFEKPSPSNPSTLPSSHSPWWMRLRTACVRLAARRRASSQLQSSTAVPPEDS